MSEITMLDLTDEILLMILKKLDQIEVFHSLIHVNRRFANLSIDHVYIRDLNLVDMTNMKSSSDSLPLYFESISKASQQIVPRIRHYVEKLTVEQTLAKDILSGSYPRLYSLSLMNFDEDILYKYLTVSDELIFHDVLKQITHLSVDMKNTGELVSETIANMFALILCSCQKLVDFNFCDVLATQKCLTLVSCPTLLNNCMSTSLVKLQINIFHMVDLFVLLDGRLESLSTLKVSIHRVDYGSDLNFAQLQENLLRLKYLSLTVMHGTFSFNSTIVPLLRRVINLQQLNLNLYVKRHRGTYVDGNEMFNEFLIYMTKLSTFTFSIRTKVFGCTNVSELPSNEHIRRTFTGRYNQMIDSYIHTDLPRKCGKCHVYTLPYEFNYFYEIDCYFQCGIFNNLRHLMIHTEITYEQKFFSVISQEMPFLQSLAISNRYPIEQKQSLLNPITFPHLSLLDLRFAHVDYVELILLKRNTNVPCLTKLIIDCEPLIAITNGFTDDQTSFNFGTLQRLDVYDPFVQPENFREYFPLVKSLKREVRM